MSYVDVSSIVDSGFHLIPEPDKISRYSEIAHALTPISQSASIIKHVEVSQNTFRPRGSHYSRKYLRTITMNGRTGVSVADALEAKFDGLDNAKEPFFTTLGNSTKGTIRIEVHGYPPYSQQIPIRDGKRQSKALDMGKQSHAIAKAISKMIEDYQYIDVGANHRWKLGPDGITVEHLLLVDVYQVSVNSFQPTMFVAYKH